LRSEGAGREAHVLLFQEERDTSIEAGAVNLIKLAVAHQFDCELELSKRLFDIGDGKRDCVHGV
jgi:hypothetical protein